MNAFWWIGAVVVFVLVVVAALVWHDDRVHKKAMEQARREFFEKYGH